MERPESGFRSLSDSDALLTLSQAARLLPSRPHPSALWRWSRGIDVEGNVVRLKTLRFGRRIYVRRTDLFEFGEALAAAHGVRGVASPAATTVPGSARTGGRA